MKETPRRRPAPTVRPRMEALPLEREELVAWLRMTMTPRLGNVAFRRLCCAFGLRGQVLQESQASLARCAGAALAASLLEPTTPPFEWQIDYTSMWLEDPEHHLVTLGDPAYPPAPLASPDPTTMIYVRGRLELLHPGAAAEPAIAIVGSRRSSASGRTHAEQFARALGAAGVTVISGLAEGIDAAAHWGALHTVGGTVAIVGTGVDRVYPRVNAPLDAEIGTAGAIVSEWPLNTRARAAHFPRRNRLIAALGVGVLVVEAAPYSGSLITARLAAD